MGLRKRSWTKGDKKHDTLDIVFKKFYRSVPALGRYRIGKVEKSIGSRVVQGRIKGRYNADYELDVFKDDKDIIVKINIWGKKRDGISYRVSIPVADKVSKKFAKWVTTRLSEIRQGKA